MLKMTLDFLEMSNLCLCLLLDTRILEPFLALKVSDVPEKALKWRLFPEFGLSCVFVTNVISIFCLASWHYFGTKIIPKILSAILVPKNRRMVKKLCLASV